MRKLVIATVALALSGCAHVASPFERPKWGPFTGRIVDVDTGQPIPGAVAYAFWVRLTGILHYQERMHDAQFAVANEQGEYTIPRGRRPLSPIPASEGPHLTWAAPRYKPVSFERDPDGTFVIGMRQWARLTDLQRGYYGGTNRISDERRRDMLNEINATRRGMGLLPMRGLDGGW